MEQTLIIIIGVGTGIAALGLLAQLGLWLAIYGVGRRMQKCVMEMRPKMQSLAAAARASFSDGKGEVLRIRDGVREAIGVTRREVATLHHLRDDAERLVQHERDRADEVFTDAVERARETSRFVEQGIAAPIRGIARAIRRFRPAA